MTHTETLTTFHTRPTVEGFDGFVTNVAFSIPVRDGAALRVTSGFRGSSLSPAGAGRAGLLMGRRYA